MDTFLEKFNDFWLPFITFVCGILFSFIGFLGAQKSNILYKTELTLEYSSKIREWAEEVVNTLSQLNALCHLDPEKYEEFRFQHVTLINQLSALIDRGRWHFKNSQSENYGTNKEKTYKGFKHPVLAILVALFDTARTIDYTCISNHKECSTELTRGKRKFVALIQDIIYVGDWKELILNDPLSKKRSS